MFALTSYNLQKKYNKTTKIIKTKRKKKHNKNKQYPLMCVAICLMIMKLYFAQIFSVTIVWLSSLMNQPES